MTIRGPIIAPRAAQDPRVAIGSQAGVTSDLLLTTLSGPPTAPPPGLQYDWPVPNAREFAAQLRSWAASYNPNLVGQDQIFAGPGQTHPYDWPVPNGYPFSVQLRSWTAGYNPNLIGRDRIYGAPGQAPIYDWPNPRAPAAGPARNSRDGVANGLLRLLAPPAPHNQYDWPLPTPYAFAVQLRSWTASYNRNLAGKDRIFGAPGETHPYDWPLPRAREFPAALRTGFAVHPPIVQQPFSRGYIID